MNSAPSSSALEKKRSTFYELAQTIIKRSTTNDSSFNMLKRKGVSLDVIKDTLYLLSVETNENRVRVSKTCPAYRNSLDMGHMLDGSGNLVNPSLGSATGISPPAMFEYKDGKQVVAKEFVDPPPTKKSVNLSGNSVLQNKFDFLVRKNALPSCVSPRVYEIDVPIKNTELGLQISRSFLTEHNDLVLEMGAFLATVDGLSAKIDDIPYTFNISRRKRDAQKHQTSKNAAGDKQRGCDDNDDDDPNKISRLHYSWSCFGIFFTCKMAQNLANDCQEYVKKMMKDNRFAFRSRDDDDSDDSMSDDDEDSDDCLDDDCDVIMHDEDELNEVLYRLPHISTRFPGSHSEMFPITVAQNLETRRVYDVVDKKKSRRSRKNIEATLTIFHGRNVKKGDDAYKKYTNKGIASNGISGNMWNSSTLKTFTVESLKERGLYTQEEHRRVNDQQVFLRGDPIPTLIVFMTTLTLTACCAFLMTIRLRRIEKVEVFKVQESNVQGVQTGSCNVRKSITTVTSRLYACACACVFVCRKFCILVQVHCFLRTRCINF